MCVLAQSTHLSIPTGETAGAAVLYDSPAVSHVAGTGAHDCEWYGMGYASHWAAVCAQLWAGVCGAVPTYQNHTVCCDDGGWRGGVEEDGRACGRGQGAAYKACQDTCVSLTHNSHRWAWAKEGVTVALYLLLGIPSVLLQTRCVADGASTYCIHPVSHHPIAQALAVSVEWAAGVASHHAPSHPREPVGQWEPVSLAENIMVR